MLLHLAAQPIVRASYENPRYTFDTNVMGTVNVLECARSIRTIKSIINITTDKVYENKEWEWGYREKDRLGGYDPYSNSKSCSELITNSYRNSFFNDKDISVSTVRAGNVIGGGDFAKDRIIPDCIRAALQKRELVVRNPLSTRPYQHVIEPLIAYLTIAMAQWENPEVAGAYNVGPNDSDCYSTGELVSLFKEKWGNDFKYIYKCDNGPHEANFLKLDCSKIRSVFGICPRWSLKEAVSKTIEWTKGWVDGADVLEIMDLQIDDYFSKLKDVFY